MTYILNELVSHNDTFRYRYVDLDTIAISVLALDTGIDPNYRCLMVSQRHYPAF